MIPIANCSLTRGIADNTEVLIPAELSWISDPRDWLFADEWEEAAKGTADPKKIDSVEFAKIAEGRWNYLRQRKECALSWEDGKSRSREHPKSEYGFGIALRMSDGRWKRTVGFIHVRRLWSGNFCLEFLGTFAPPGIKHIGFTLLTSLGGLAEKSKVGEVWGGMHRRLEGLLPELQNQTDDRELGRLLSSQGIPPEGMATSWGDTRQVCVRSTGTQGDEFSF